MIVNFKRYEKTKEANVRTMSNVRKKLISLSIIFSLLLHLATLPGCVRADELRGRTGVNGLRGRTRVNEQVMLQQTVDYKDKVDKVSDSLFRDYMNRSHKRLEDLYRSMWVQKHMDRKLKQAVSYAVNEVKEGTSFLSKLKLFHDKDSQERMIQNVFEKCMIRFSKPYENFIESFIEVFSRAALKDLKSFSKTLKRSRVKEARFVSGHNALAEIQLEPLLTQIGAATQIPEIKLPAGISQFKGTMGLAGLYGFKKLFAKRIKRQLVKKGLRAVGAKAITFLEGPVGWAIGIVLVGFDIWNIGKEVSIIPEKLESSFYASFRKTYFVLAPNSLWKMISPVMEKKLDNVVLVMNSFDEIVQQLSLCPSYRGITSGLSEKQCDILAKKLLLLEKRIGNVDLCRLVETLGPVLSRVSPRHISCIAKAGTTMNLEKMAKWLELVGKEFCILRRLPEGVWNKYDPSPENIDVMRWLSNLPRGCQMVAADLSPDTAKWIMRNLDSTQQILLFKGRSADEIEREAGRQTSLSPEERGIPRKKLSKKGFFDDAKIQLSALAGALPGLHTLVWVGGSIVGVSLLVLALRWVSWVIRGLFYIFPKRK